MFLTNINNKITGHYSSDSTIYNIQNFYELKFDETSLDGFNSKVVNPNSSIAFERTYNQGYSGYDPDYSNDYSLDIQAIKNSNPVANYMSGDYNTNSRSSGYVFLKYQIKSDGLFNATIDIDGITGSLIFDLNESDTIDALSENLNVMDLFALDDNRDGLLNEDDKYFDKLKVVITNQNSENVMVKLSSLVSFVNLEDYIDKDKIPEHIDNQFLRYTDPRYSYDKYDKELLNDVFDELANEDGWIKLNKDTAPLFESLAYKRKNIEGDSYLQKINKHAVVYKPEANEFRIATGFNHYYSASQRGNPNKFSGFSSYMKSDTKNGVGFTSMSDVNGANLIAVQQDRFSNIYDAYNDLIDSGATKREFIKIEKEFERVTRLDFSKENLEKVKKEVDSGRLTDTFIDMDTIVGIKKDGNKGYMLLFDTKRLVRVDDLYFNTGDFLKMDGNKRVSILFEDEVLNFDFNEDFVIDANELNFETFSYKDDGRFKTLKEAGVKLIEIHKDTQKVQFELLFENGDKKGIDTLYKVIDLNKANKVNSSTELNEIINHPYQNRVENDSKTLYLT